MFSLRQGTFALGKERSGCPPSPHVVELHLMHNSNILTLIYVDDNLDK
jgi:hypothetical protein